MRDSISQMGSDRARLARIAGATAWALVVATCTGEEPGQRGLCPEPAAGGPVALFDIFEPGGEELAPFPSDLKTVFDPASPTGMRLSFGENVFAPALNELDGFGLRSVMLVPHARSIDPATLPATPADSLAPGSSVFLIDIDGIEDAAAGTLDGRKIAVETGSVHDSGSLFMEPSIVNAIAVRPEGFLEPVHRYAMVVTACVTSPAGDGLGTQDSFAALREGGTHPDASAQAVENLHDVIAYLEREGYDRGDLAMVTTFTTQSVDDDLVAARTIVDGLEVANPVVGEVYDTLVASELNPDMLARMPGVVALLSDFDLSTYRFDRIDKVVFGTFEAPSFVDETDLVNRDLATWRPATTGTETLEFMLTLPREVPAEGIGPPYGVLVYQHAMGVCKETILPLADTMARFGIAVVGIDAMQHGSRHPDGPGGCEMEFTDFFAFENFARTSAYFEQSVIDIWSLVRMLREAEPIDVLPYPGGDGVPDLTTSRMAFAGQSMGASMGMNAMALEPAFDAGVVNVGMGYLTDLMLAGMGIDLPETPMPDLDGYDLFQMNLGLIVPTISDKCDPIHWADNLIANPMAPWRTGPMSVLYQHAACDEVVPYEAYERTAGLMRIPAVEPMVRPIEGLSTVSAPVRGNLDAGHTAALFQFDAPAEHAFLLTCDDPATMFAGQLQLAVFVSASLRGETPVVIDPFDPSQVAAYAPAWEAP